MRFFEQQPDRAQEPLLRPEDARSDVGAGRRALPGRRVPCRPATRRDGDLRGAHQLVRGPRAARSATTNAASSPWRWPTSCWPPSAAAQTPDRAVIVPVRCVVGPPAQPRVSSSRRPSRSTPGSGDQSSSGDTDEAQPRVEPLRRIGDPGPDADHHRRATQPGRPVDAGRDQCRPHTTPLGAPGRPRASGTPPRPARPARRTGCPAART